MSVTETAEFCFLGETSFRGLFWTQPEGLCFYVSYGLETAGISQQELEHDGCLESPQNLLTAWPDPGWCDNHVSLKRRAHASGASAHKNRQTSVLCSGLSIVSNSRRFSLWLLPHRKNLWKMKPKQNKTELSSQPWNHRWNEHKKLDVAFLECSYG